MELYAESNRGFPPYEPKILTTTPSRSWWKMICTQVWYNFDRIHKLQIFLAKNVAESKIEPGLLAYE